MSPSAAGLPVTEIAEKATVRLIPTAFFKPPVLSPLSGPDAGLDDLARLEALTNRRLRGQREGLLDLDPRELAFRARAEGLRLWGHTHVNAAFLYTRPGGNRFNDADRGAWYCAFGEMTAIEEVGYHRTRELRFSRCFEDEAVYQALLADFIGPFPDLRQVADADGSLHPDPDRGYPAGQRLARDLRAAGHGGLLYPSVRHPGGSCFVAFEPQIVQNLRPGARWVLRWDGDPRFTVTVNPAETPIALQSP